MPPKTASFSDSDGMNVHAQVPKEEAATIISAVTGFADKAAKQSDRWWLSVLMLIGIAVLGFMLKWHRDDQKSLSDLFTTTLKANTESLSRMGVQMERAAVTNERVERQLLKLEK